MGQKVQIDCDGYSVVMESKNLRAFADSSKQDHIRTLTGEDLVQAFLNHAKGKISEVRRLKDDVPNDGPNGEWAIEEFNDAGGYVAVHHKINGKATANGGQPGSFYFNPGNELRNASYYDDEGRLVRSTNLDGKGNILTNKGWNADGSEKFSTDNTPKSTYVPTFISTARAAPAPLAPQRTRQEIDLETLQTRLRTH